MALIPLPGRVELWLVRHGSTTWSEAGRLCGRTDVPLSARGRSEARALREHAAGVLAWGPAGIWSSDLLRARETAELVGLPASPDPRLRELDFGSLEGERWEELPSEVRGELLGFDGFRAPGGESVDELAARVRAFLDDLRPGLHVLVTHGGVIRLLLRGRGAEAHVRPGETVWLEGQPAARS